MRVRILHHPTLKIGSVIDAPDEQAEWLIRSGRGEIAKEEANPVIETATVAPVENAAVRTTRPVGRPPHAAK